MRISDWSSDVCSSDLGTWRPASSTRKTRCWPRSRICRWCWSAAPGSPSVRRPSGWSRPVSAGFTCSRAVLLPGSRRSCRWRAANNNHPIDLVATGEHGIIAGLALWFSLSGVFAMADEQTNGAAGAAEQGTQAQFNLQKVYIKDASFEAPNSPAIFNEQTTPALQLNRSENVSVLGEGGYEGVQAETLH